MDRHKLEQLRDKIGELLQFGSSSCIRQAHGIMNAEFENVLYFALEKTEPKPKPQHTIADNYPAGGIPEPCMFCEDHEELENKITELQAKLDKPIADHPDVQRLVGQVAELQAEQRVLKAANQILQAENERLKAELKAVNEELSQLTHECIEDGMI